jgi:hypothetical protein
LPMVGNRQGAFFVPGLEGRQRHLGEIGRDHVHPSLTVAGIDAGTVHLGDHGHGPGDFGGLGLGAAHAAQARRDEQQAGQIAVGRDAAHLSRAAFSRVL